MRHLLTTLRTKLQQDSGGLAASVAKLVSGTLGARLIGVMALPFLSRLYSPESFGSLSAYLSVVTLIGVVACLRTEIAIPIVERDEDAAPILAFACLSAAAVAILTFGVLSALFAFRPSLLGAAWTGTLTYLAPVGVFGMALHAALQNWAVRKKRFSSIAKSKIQQSFVGAVSGVALGYAGFATAGLILSNIANVAGGNSAILRDAWRTDRALFSAVSWKKVLAVPQQQRRFAGYSTFDAWINTAGLQLPILMIAARSGEVAGHFFMAFQLLVLPMNMLTGAISQVYLSQAPAEYRAGRLAAFTSGMIHKLALFGIPAFVFAAIAGPAVVPAVLGASWQEAGTLVPWLVPWLALQLVSSPVSMALHITQNQAGMLLLAVAGFILRFGAVFVVGLVQPTLNPVIVLAGASAVYYALVLAAVIAAARIRVAALSLSSWASVAALAAAAAAAATFFHIVIVRF
jgi:O-antigen/teichoic acid export membrane protein